MTNKISTFALVVALVALGAVFFRAPSLSVKKETAFERVMRTRTVRCAYISRPHHFMIDAANNQKSGIDYDVVEAVGKLINLRIDWVEETGYGSFPEQLSSGKEDALCTTVWTSVARAARVLYTAPILYSPLYVYTRDGDTRFDYNLEAVNDEKITIATIDGSTMQAIADASFSRAKKLAAPGLTDDGTMMLNLAAGKGDVTFFDEIVVDDYNQHNPDKKLRRVTGVAPVRIYPETYSVAMGEWEMRELFNAAIAELHNNGTIGRVLSKYENTPGEIMRVISPYAAQAKR